MWIEMIEVIVVLLFAVVFHEVAHGWVANKLGDPTAKFAGRLTLNPLKHIDPVGMIIVPLALKLLGVPFVIGWAKPVPVNFFHLRNPKRDMMTVALAGPGVNFLLAIFCSGLLRWLSVPVLHDILVLGVVLNLMLGVFNLIPIPPLDGSRVVAGLLPEKWARPYAQLESWGFVILLVLLNFGVLDFVGNIVNFLAVHLGI